MNRTDARAILQRCNISADSDQFHALDTDRVESLIAEADRAKYRAPKNANGSRARYFHAFVVRVANRAR